MWLRALLDAQHGRGQLGLFEVDEAWLPNVARAVRPHTYLLANLFRDQLDRYGELELLADRRADLTADETADGSRQTHLMLNSDDPLVADLGRGRGGVTYFGLSDESQALPELQHAADSKHCRNCGHAYIRSDLPRPPRALVAGSLCFSPVELPPQKTLYLLAALVFAAAGILGLTNGETVPGALGLVAAVLFGIAAFTARDRG